MIKEIKCNVWSKLNSNTAVCILTNETIYKDENVMGGGIAKEAACRNFNLKSICAKAIRENNFSLGRDVSGAEMLRFSTKDNVWENSKLHVIENSLNLLRNYCNVYPNKLVYLPRPGCGLGGLDWETQVKPLCEKYLDDLDNVFITYM